MEMRDERILCRFNLQQISLSADFNHVTSLKSLINSKALIM